MKKMTLQDIKNTELELLINFQTLCNDNGLYYTLCGGTLLGAVRHKGFIPWDDDIDVLMPRPDYDRLLNDIDINKDAMPEYVKVYHWKNGKLNFPFIKLVDTRTKVNADYFNSEISINHIWIDIFPIDGNPADEKELEKLYHRSLFWRKILCLRLAQKGEGKTVVKRLLKPILISLMSVFPLEKLCSLIDNISKSYGFENENYIGGVVWGYGPQERIDKKSFLNAVQLEFEGHYFNAPSNYDEYLRGLYKNYMQLPPDKDRVVHGLTAYIKE